MSEKPRDNQYTARRWKVEHSHLGHIVILPQNKVKCLTEYTHTTHAKLLNKIVTHYSRLLFPYCELLLKTNCYKGKVISRNKHGSELTCHFICTSNRFMRMSVHVWAVLQVAINRLWTDCLIMAAKHLLAVLVNVVMLIPCPRARIRREYWFQNGARTILKFTSWKH